MSDEIVLIALLIGGVAGVLFVEALVVRPMLGVWLVLTRALSTIVFDRSFGFVVSGISVSIADIVAVLLGAAAMLRLLRTRRLGAPQKLLLVLTAFVALNLVRGIATFGLQPATNEFREFFTFLTAALYVSTFPPSRVRDGLVWAWQLVAVVLLGVCVMRWADKLLGVSAGPFALGERSVTMVFGEGDSLRVIHANDTLLLLQAVLILVALWAFRRRDDGLLKPPGMASPLGVNALPWLAAVSFMSVVLLQHRTVWIATLISSVVLLVGMRDRRLNVNVAALLVVVLLVGSTVMVLNTGNEQLPDPLQDQLTRSATNDNTFQWRLLGWVELIRGVDRSPLDFLVGDPFGSGYSRWVAGQVTEVNPHSTYVTFFLRAGSAGFAVLLGMYGLTIRALRRRRTQNCSLPDPVIVALLASQLVFGVTYNAVTEQGLLLGLAIAAAGTASGSAQDQVHDLGHPGVVIRSEGTGQDQST